MIIGSLDNHKYLFIYKLEKAGCPKNFENFNPQAPVAQKTADEVVFRRFQGEEVEFFKFGLH